jgi:hypothetical protein
MTGQSHTRSKLGLFFSYAHEDQKLRLQLDNHLSTLKRQGYIETWHDRRIRPGQEWAGQIDQHLERAQVILLLVSSYFLASDYCYDKEMARAFERRKTGEAQVIAVILRPCDWTETPFSELQCLPTDAKPVTSWSNRDEAFLDVARGIRKTVGELLRAEEQKVKSMVAAVRDSRPDQLSGLGDSLLISGDRTAAERWSDLQETQRLIYEIQKDANEFQRKHPDRVNKIGDELFKKWDQYLRS